MTKISEESSQHKRKYKYKWITSNDDITLPLLAKRRVRVKVITGNPVAMNKKAKKLYQFIRK
jgi:hypothetical protein